MITFLFSICVYQALVAIEYLPKYTSFFFAVVTGVPPTLAPVETSSTSTPTPTTTPSTTPTTPTTTSGMYTVLCQFELVKVHGYTSVKKNSTICIFRMFSFTSI